MAALLFVLYPIIGLALGAVGGLLLASLRGVCSGVSDAPARSQWQAMGTFTVACAYAMNFALLPPHRSDILLLLVYLALAVALLLGIWPGVWRRRLGFLANPWTTSLILVGLSWVLREWLPYRSRTLKGTAALAYLVTVLSLSFAVQRIPAARRARRRASESVTPPGRAFAYSLALVLLTFGTLFALTSDPRLPPRAKAANAASGHLNVVLIVLDTVRADHLGAYGYGRNTTPNLTNFSKEAVLYRHAIAPSDMTLSSHASIFTGLYPRGHGAHGSDRSGSPEGQIGSPLAGKFHTLAETLSENGYLTLAVVANHAYLGRAFHLDQGFQYYSVLVPILGMMRRFYLAQPLRDFLACDLSPAERRREYVKAEDINRKVLALLDQVRQRREPFFLFVNYMDAHIPRVPPPPFDTLFAGGNESPDPDPRAGAAAAPSASDPAVTARYDGAIAYLDFELGRLLDYLRKTALDDRSMIIITSDHGEALGERGLYEHGLSVYQDQVYVPLLIKYPGSKEGAAVDQVVSLVDLLPTVLETLGCPIPKEVQGRSLFSRASGRPIPVVSEHFPGIFANSPGVQGYGQRAIFSGSKKFIRSAMGKRELYDFLQDPSEQANLYRAGDPASKEMEDQLDQWLKTVAPQSAAPARLDPDTLRRLKSLGYVQ